MFFFLRLALHLLEEYYLYDKILIFNGIVLFIMELQYKMRKKYNNNSANSYCSAVCCNLFNEYIILNDLGSCGKGQENRQTCKV